MDRIDGPNKMDRIDGPDKKGGIDGSGLIWGGLLFFRYQG
jgi:hypothetical protein